MKILINAYACSPGMGSEPGMAWNWVSNLAKFCELYYHNRRGVSGEDSGCGAYAGAGQEHALLL